MPTKVSWGMKLTPEDIQERDERFRENCAMLKAEVEKRLEGIGADIRVDARRRVCVGCENAPSECPDCQVDPSMSKSFEAASLVIYVNQRPC